MRTALIALMAGVMVLSAGCSKKAKTPEDAVINMANALENGDKDLFMANVKFSDEKLAVAMFESMHATKVFADKYEKEYGKDKMPKDFDMTTPTPEEIKEKIKIEQKDGKTFAKLDGDDIPLVEEDGAWKVDSTHESQGGDSRQAIEMANKMKVAAENAAKKVGKPEYKDNPEKIWDEMHKEMFAGFFDKLTEDAQRLSDESQRIEEEAQRALDGGMDGDE